MSGPIADKRKYKGRQDEEVYPLSNAKSELRLLLARLFEVWRIVVPRTSQRHASAILFQTMFRYAIVRTSVEAALNREWWPKMN